MADSRVLDTNVLIVASAADGGSPFRPEATPVEEDELRQQVLNWLVAFERDASQHVVLDWDWLICDEYTNKLGEQDYGWLAMMSKRDRNEVIWVGLDVDQDGYANLPARLATAVTDLADRKMVAAVLAVKIEGHTCQLVNACDTDWLDCRAALRAHRVEVEHLLSEWLQTKWEAKHAGARRRRT